MPTAASAPSILFLSQPTPPSLPPPRRRGLVRLRLPPPRGSSNPRGGGGGKGGDDPTTSWVSPDWLTSLSRSVTTRLGRGDDSGIPVASAKLDGTSSAARYSSLYSSGSAWMVPSTASPRGRAISSSSATPPLPGETPISCTISTQKISLSDGLQSIL